MKLLAILCLVAGAVTSLTAFRAINGRWGSFGELASVTGVLNVLVGLIAYALFRRTASPGASTYRIGLILAYIAGLVCGGYLYFN
jgi:hypothetical protein